MNIIGMTQMRDWFLAHVAPARGFLFKTTILLAATAGAVTSNRAMRNPCLDEPAARAHQYSWWEAPRHEGMVRLQFAGSPRNATAVLDEWKFSCRTEGDPLGHQPAERNLRYDRAFIMSYVVGLFLLAFMTMAIVEKPFMRMLGATVGFLVLVAGLLDVIENRALWRMLTGSVGTWWPDIARIAASLKLAMLAAVLTYLLLVWMSRLMMRVYRLLNGPVPLTFFYVGRPQPTALDQSPDDQPGSFPTKSVNLLGAHGPAATIQAVARAELDHLHFHRHPDKEREHVERQLVGLALSGGGIRSATTCLGILQALAELRVLPFVDYMCTVSGGGYIGTCLSSLLSLNASKLPSRPEQCPQPNAHIFGDNDVPAFDTTKKHFPFRDDFIGTAARRANALVAHLRTHGNFLIARRGLLRRDAMRALGNIMTGMVYNVAGFLLILFIIATLYLSLVNMMSPEVHGWLLVPQPKVVRAEPSKERLGLSDIDSSATRRITSSCPATSAICTQERATSLRAPHLGSWIKRNMGNVSDPVRLAISGEGTRSEQLQKVVLGSLAMGALSALLALLLVSFSRYLFLTENLPPQSAGEAYEETFDKTVLKVLTLFTLGWIVVTVAAFRYWVPSGSDQMVVIWIPLLVLIGARLMSIAIAVLRPQIRPRKFSRTLGRITISFDISAWDQSFRTLWGGYQAIAIYGWWMAALFVMLAPLMYAFADNRTGASLAGFGAILVSHFLTPTKSTGNKRAPVLPPKVQQMLLGIAVFLAIGFGVIALGAVVVSMPLVYHLELVVSTAILALLILGRIVDSNKLSLHYFYRDRLAETYMLSEMPDEEGRLWTFRNAMEMPLHELHGDFLSSAVSRRNTAPYHLISAAINLAGSRDLTRKDRKSGYFLFSKLYCGSTHTGFRPTAIYRHGETKLARAAAISGAAASSGIGFSTFFAQAFATVLFNVRLGYWLENPAYGASEHDVEEGIFWPAYLWREVSMATTENSKLINVSDGGHTGDNVGIYPLLQRRCKVIIACDAEQDGDLTFGSFTEALRHAYVDLGINVDIDLSMIRPDAQNGYSRSHCAIGRIRYPDRPSQASYLIYIKNSLTGDEPEPVLNYKVACSEFPHETTADQFFDDAQFESYRALGVHMARDAFASWAESDTFLGPQRAHTPQPARP